MYVFLSGVASPPQNLHRRFQVSAILGFFLALRNHTLYLLSLGSLLSIFGVDFTMLRMHADISIRRLALLRLV